MLQRSFLACALVASALPATSAVSAQTRYSFTVIADSADGFDPAGFGCPAMGSEGNVAFKGVLEGVQGIFRGRGAALTVIAMDNGTFGFIGNNPSINSVGDVSFAANLDAGGEAILRGRGGPLTTIAQTDPGVFAFFGFDTSVNDAGVVAFKAELDNFDEGLFFGSGGPIATVYLASTSPFLGTDVGPALNNVGQIAFHEQLDNFTPGIFRSTGTTIVTIADARGFLADFPYPPGINDNGVVVFAATNDEGGQAVLIGSGGPVTRVADNRGPFASFDFGGPGINDANEVVFTATLDTGVQGIFTGPDPLLDRVIETGDTLAGAVVINLTSCREALNNRGQLAFRANLDDGRTVLVRANPAP
jgi:hypothetical protein